MTDQVGTSSAEDERAERIRRLQERRAQSGRSAAAAAKRPVSSTGSSTGLSTGKSAPAQTRRRHPAAASRVLLAGLSVASFFTVGGSMLLANNGTQAAAPATASPAVSAGVSTATSAASTAATPVASTAKSTSVPVVHTTTRGS